MMRHHQYRSIGLFVLVGFVSTAELTALEFPLTGVVSNPGKLRNSVRDAPPTTTALSYELAKRICGVGNGTEFIATEETHIVNGEIWFKIQTTNMKSTKDCPSEGVTGWMIAKLKTKWVVTITKQNIPLRPEEINTETSEPTAQKEEDIKDEEIGALKKYAPISNYVLLLVGTLLGGVVIAVERAGKITREVFSTRLFWFEVIALSVVNVLAVTLLIDELFQVSNTSPLFNFLKIVQSAPGGFALFGFSISVIMLKLISFK
ncbi:MAG: hypothetical protein GY854_31080 [Deltaproteobacteria bacterium]|nr:hypothetical protein [Deltaproteobacteria bacterium]